MALQSCCLDDKLMAMYIDRIPNLAKQVPSIFVNVGDGINLATLFNASSGDLLPLVQNFVTDNYTTLPCPLDHAMHTNLIWAF